MLQKFYLFLKGVIEHLMVVAMTLLFWQFPQLYQQYLDALTGAHYEARKALSLLEESARERGKSLRDYIEKHLKSQDNDFRTSGKNMEKALQRESFYRSALDKLKRAPFYLWWWYFIIYVEFGLLREISFQPGIPLSTAGLFYAAFGMLTGMGISYLVFGIWGSFFTKKTRI
ncbi:MAG: DUF2937 family protein [Leptospiraceae bacterium]|nr:DUF2937 family protein [Leptospiraceae bacterium]MDW8306668.1 DUF2937 family protein [Leptospiraceae bacterium]